MISKRSFINLLLILDLFSSCKIGHPSSASVNIDRSNLKTIIKNNSEKPLLINFWATWCETCSYEMKELDKLQTKYLNKGLKIILISIDNGSDKITKALVDFKYSDIQWIEDKYISKEKNVKDIMTVIDNEWIEVIPVTYLIDNNKIERYVGGRANNELKKRLLLLNSQPGIQRP